MKSLLRRAVLVVVVGVVGLCGYIWSSLTPPAGPEPSHTEFTLDDVTVVAPGQGRTEHQALAVKEGVIAEISERGSLQIGKHLDEYSGAFVLPGLIDLHTHLPPDSALQLTRFFGVMYLAHGVTTVRDAGDLDGTAIPAAKRTFETEQNAGPRLFTSGPFVAGGDPRWENTVVVRNKAEVRAAIQRIRSEGFDGVKSYEDLSTELVHEVARAAEDAGLLVIGHVPMALRFEEARIPDTLHFLGVPLPENIGRDHVFNRIADWDEVDEARLDEVVAAALEYEIANTPTLVVTDSLLRYEDYESARTDPDMQQIPRMFRDVVWHPGEGLAIWRSLTPDQLERLRSTVPKKHLLLRKLYDAGAELRIGTDTQQPFVVPGASVHQEMRLFVEAGVPLEEVWRIATQGAGKALRLDRLGTCVSGAPADFLIFREDPTQDLAAMDSLVAVVSQGRLYTRGDLDAALATYKRHFDGWLFDRLSVAVTRRILASAVKRGN